MPTDFNWADYGILGGVIFALFCLIYFIIKIGLDKFENISNRSSEDFAVLQSLHQSERAEWLASEEKRTDKTITSYDNLSKSLNSLEHTIQLQNERYRQSDRQPKQGG